MAGININTHVDPSIDPNVTVNTGGRVNTGGGNATVNVGGGSARPQVNVGSRENASSSNQQQAATEASNAAAAAAAEEARRLAEAARNEALTREKDANIARSARKKQAERQASNVTPATSTDTSPLAQAWANARSAARGESVTPRIETISANDVGGGEVADSDMELEEQPRTQAENLGALDTQTGEVFETTPERANIPSGVTSEPGTPGRPRQQQMAESVMAEAMSDAVQEAAPEVAYNQRDEAPKSTGRTEARVGTGRPSVAITRTNMFTSKSARDDVVVNEMNDVTGMNGTEAQLNEILRQETRRHSSQYRRLHEKSVAEEIGIAYKDREIQEEYDPLDFFQDDMDEGHLERALMMARNAMLQRFLNPFLLRVQNEKVETTTKKVDGKNRTFGHIVYGERTQRAIEAVQSMYGCSVYNVMQLVQLRGGIGVSIGGKIANVNPNEFRLTEDQFVELCRDICVSQMNNGNPLGAVKGVPGANNVRDDTGDYVVVAGTRCFPLGYMPRQLMFDLCASETSVLHNVSTKQLASDIGDQWINFTYPQLCANTGGNLMFQARAIENMMRGLMMADGVNPADLDIPEVIERQTLMALRAEQACVVDGDIKDANEVKRNEMESALSRFRHRYQKERQYRDEDGRLQSAYERRRNKYGDAMRSINMMERAAKAANIGVMISSVPESWVAGRMQSAANFCYNATFNFMHKDLADQYKVSAALDRMSVSKEAVEAREVAESLYRIGGHDAIDAFLASVGEDGKLLYRMTKADFRKFLQDYGVTGPGASVSDRVRSAFKVKPGEEAGFLSNANRIANGIEDMMLGSNMFMTTESRQFVQMSMAEMARASLHNRESYTTEQVEGFGISGGGEELIRSLLMTDAGREAFMTQGITSLGRKSPIEHQMRLVMSKNGLTEFAVRTMFDRFPEYGVNKVLQMVPFSNTLSYLTARGIHSVGDILVTANTDTMVGRAIVSTGESMQRNLGYQAGGRTSFAEGFRKNLLYDTVMSMEKLGIAALYCGIIMALGGVQPPDDDRDRYTWSEWKIGDGEDAVPLKWAWWMDDLSGVGLPLGMAWAICLTGDWSSDSKQDATNTFLNAIANFNSGTALFDAIDLVNNFDEEVDALFGKNVGSWDPDYNEWAMSQIEQGFWNLIGDVTPTFVGQLIPWSKDFILAGDRDAHTASRVYDVGEGSKYSMEEAQEGYKTRQVGSYAEYQRRRSSQTNILQAMFYDMFKGEDETGYKYTEQPVDTMTDPYVQSMYEQFFLDLDPKTSNLPLDPEERQAELYARAEAVCQHIDQNYKNPLEANLDGFALNYDSRVNCINYCYHMIDLAWDRYDDETSNGWLDNVAYQEIVDRRQETIEHYQNLIYNYFQSDEIPWSMPRYVRQESERETRYVDENGNAGTYLGTIGGLSQNSALRNAIGSIPFVGQYLANAIGEQQTSPESYWYGNGQSLLPASRPNTEGKGHNFETIPYWAVLDEDGNPVNDTGRMYDRAANLTVGTGRDAGRNVQELMWGGQGTNMGPESDEELRIPREGVPTLGGIAGSGGGRPWRAMEEVFPESLKNLDADSVTELLGIPASLPKEGEERSSKNANDNSGGGNSYGYASYEYSGGGSYYGGSGGSSYTYNPKIYSTPRQVYSQRASGLSTRTPYKATSTYLRPSFYTSGSRMSYKRQQ